LLDNSLRWHVCASDLKSQEFRDFVITRIKNSCRPQGAAGITHERSDQDIQWTRIVELELVPHPDQLRPEITQMDYAMTGESIRMRVHAAVAGYMSGSAG
jgi:predicted DNA-binding transcriptional regulator YafY